MERKKAWITVAASAVLFLAACAFSILFSQDDTESWERTTGGSIVLSEIMSSNRTYPAPDGNYLDFIEIRNLSGSAVDISGYMLADDADSIGYTFADGTVLPGYGYAVCWCNKDGDSDEYADFGISRAGGETIYLYNNANVVVDQKEVPEMRENTSLIRENETTWSVTTTATPGFENTEEGYARWLSSMGEGDVKVVITEVVTDNTCITTGGDSDPFDYVELTNMGSRTVTLEGAFLSNDPEELLKWQMPSLTLAAGESAVVYCAGTGDGSEYAPFALSKSGCTVTLSGKLGNVLSQVVCPPLEADIAWSLSDDGTYHKTEYATPGFANDEKGYDAWLQSVGVDQLQVVISEVQTSNRSTILSAAGTLCDWVELLNTGDSAVDLSNAYLTDDASERGKWRIPSMTLQPGERVVIRCVGANAGVGEADFALSKSGCTVALTGPQGNIISSVEVPRIEDDRVWALQPDGSYAESDMPSPGYENTEKGYLSFRSSQKVTGPLAISEVMVYNDQYMIQSDGKYYDWIELENISDQTVNLADFCLSNDPDELNKMQLPQRTLGPGERVIVICSANDSLVGSYIQAPFTLSNDECWVYVSRGGVLSDYIHISDVPTQASAGRISGEGGIWYFEQPTPGNPNGSGVALVSDRPTVVTQDGVYQDVPKVSVQLQGNGTLHYTLDGSVPTQEDPVYEKPLELKKTTVVRVVSYEEDKLPSEVVTASFVINEGHTLPVLSLVADPQELFGSSGIYANNRFETEISCNLKLFENGSVFSIDCGVELAGNTANDPQKKNLKVNFRSRYGAKVLGCPIFGEDGPLVFDSLILNAGSDDGQTLFRDELFSQLCLQTGENVQTRRFKFCVLYINGEYWGVYSLKEDLGEMYYSQNAEVSVGSVTEIQEPAPFRSDIKTLAEYCQENDLSVQENYDHVASQLNIESLIDWMILQGYSCNSGIDDNVRYYRSVENGNRWQIAYYDLDKAFYYRDGFANVFAEGRPWSYLKITGALMENAGFRTAFLQRLQELKGSTLSDDNVLAVIDSLEQLLEPEMDRELERWNGDKATWLADVDRLRNFLVRYDHWGMLKESLRNSAGLTEEEAEQYLR